jgi:hypothetical protein
MERASASLKRCPDTNHGFNSVQKQKTDPDVFKDPTDTGLRARYFRGSRPITPFWRNRLPTSFGNCVPGAPWWEGRRWVGRWARLFASRLASCLADRRPAQPLGHGGQRIRQRDESDLPSWGLQISRKRAARSGDSTTRVSSAKASIFRVSPPVGMSDGARPGEVTASSIRFGGMGSAIRRIRSHLNFGSPLFSSPSPCNRGLKKLLWDA